MRLRSDVARESVRDCLRQIKAQYVSMIDVGSGPLSTLGTRFPGKHVHLIAVDPLADEYNALLQRRGIDPPVRPIPCAGEDLLDHFAPASFHIAFSENALDHAADPVRVIRNMFELVKPAGFVILDHGRNTGEYAAYGQLHQWNFDERNGRCILWRGTHEHDLVKEFGGAAELHCRLQHAAPGSQERVICVLQRHPSPTASP